MKFRYRNITLLVLFFFILGVPYALRLADWKLEIYPSAVLPFGTNKPYLKDSLRIPIKEVYGLAPDGTLKALDKATLLKHIRVVYFDLLYDARFGLAKVENRDFITNRLKIPVHVSSKVSEKDIEETKAWFRERLKEQGCSDSLLFLKQRQVIVLQDGGYIEGKEVVHDTVFELY